VIADFTYTEAMLQYFIRKCTAIRFLSPSPADRRGHGLGDDITRRAPALRRIPGCARRSPGSSQRAHTRGPGGWGSESDCRCTLRMKYCSMASV